LQEYSHDFQYDHNKDNLHFLFAGDIGEDDYQDHDYFALHENNSGDTDHATYSETEKADSDQHFVGNSEQKEKNDDKKVEFNLVWMNRNENKADLIDFEEIESMNQEKYPIPIMRENDAYETKFTNPQNYKDYYIAPNEIDDAINFRRKKSFSFHGLGPKLPSKSVNVMVASRRPIVLTPINTIPPPVNVMLAAHRPNVVSPINSIAPPVKNIQRWNSIFDPSHEEHSDEYEHHKEYYNHGKYYPDSEIFEKSKTQIEEFIPSPQIMVRIHKVFILIIKFI
jgi:hypothetical protein